MKKLTMILMMVVSLFVTTICFANEKQIQWQAVVVHISDSESMSKDQCNEWHKGRGWDSCGYNFVIEKDGTIYEGRGINKVGAHTKGYNSKYIGICFVSKNKATKDQLDTFKKLLVQYELDKLPIYPHANFANKLCGIEVAKQLGLWKITAYDGCFKCNHFNMGQTSSGIKPSRITVATNWFKLGTKIKVGEREYIVQDRGSEAKFGPFNKPMKHVDLFFPTHEQASKFGVKYMQVTEILNKGENK